METETRPPEVEVAVERFAATAEEVLDKLDEIAEQKPAVDPVTKLIVEFDDATANDPGAEKPSTKAKSFDELVAFERIVATGDWVRWQDVEDAEVHIGSYADVVVAEARLQRRYRLEHQLDANQSIPDAELEVLEAKARFGRGARGWRGAFFDGRSFDWRNFIELWRASFQFRVFVNHQSLLLRDRCTAEEEARGKG